MSTLTLDRLMAQLPPGWRVVVQPVDVMGHLWGCCWFWPKREIWISVREPEAMIMTLAHEVAHALTGGGHHQAWYQAACRLWGATFPDGEGFAEHIEEYRER